MYRCPYVKPPWSTNAFVNPLHEIKQHDVDSSWIFGDEFLDKHSREGTMQVLITLEDVKEEYIVEPAANYYC
jgi:hypothetical protein